MAICSATLELLIAPWTSPSLGVAETGDTFGAESKYALGLRNDAVGGQF
jgi:hypothetical protein